MPEYVIKVKSKEVLSGFELRLLEDRVKHFFNATAYINEEHPYLDTEVKAEYL